MANAKTETYCLDQQGGKGSANWQYEVACTILSDSHGTPHAVVILQRDDNDIDREKIL